MPFKFIDLLSAKFRVSSKLVLRESNHYVYMYIFNCSIINVGFVLLLKISSELEFFFLVHVLQLDEASCSITDTVIAC